MSNIITDTHIPFDIPFVEMPTYSVNIDYATGKRTRERSGVVYIKASEISSVDMDCDTACIYTNGDIVWRVDADDAMKVLKNIGYAKL